jgi:S1-C subfamily serine protease
MSASLTDSRDEGFRPFPNQPRARVRHAVITAGAIVAASAIGACTSGASTSPATRDTGSGTRVSSSPNGATGAAERLAVVPSIAAKAQPTVVTVIVPGGNGSGVVYSSSGLILTNEHVVRGAHAVQVGFADGERVRGTVRAVDPVTDLALVQADRRDLPVARFETRLPAVGDLAIVIGSPLGFEGTVTAGIISGLHRDLPSSEGPSQALIDLIQTDAPISPGNSGGAVFNAAGEVVGISDAYISPQSGAVDLGFAIPSATAVNIAQQLERSGHATHAFAGLQPAAITPAIAAELGLNTTDGVIVVGLAGGGPADKAGLKPGDVFTAFDGKPVTSPEEFLTILRAHQPGETITLTVSSHGQSPRRVQLTLTDRPAISR